MKTLKFRFLTVLIAALVISFGSNMYAQRPNQGPYNGKRNAPNEFAIPDLTQAQKDKIKELRTANMKETTQIKNQLQEKRARLNTLRTADKPNMNEIDKTIDEISALTAKLMKQREHFIQDVRKELTEEQRVTFDTRAPHFSANTKRPCGRPPYQGKPPVR